MPVIAVPENYILTSITSILLASDLIDYKKEVIKAVAFAEPLNATIELLHLISAFDFNKDLKAIELPMLKVQLRK